MPRHEIRSELTCPTHLGGRDTVTEHTAKFALGQMVHHRLFNYRGVVVDVDACFEGSDDWYQKMARTSPPRDTPWYHVLVHGSESASYVAERNLVADDTGEPIRHPDLGTHFFELRGNVYITYKPAN